MTQYAEVTRSTGGIDVVCFNNSATAISPGYAVLAETVSGKTCPCAVLPTNLGGNLRTLGVTVTTIPAGGYGMVCISGPALAVAHEPIATGEKVQAYDVTAHLGQVCIQTHSADCEGLGWCMQAAGADGDVCEVFVSPYYVVQGA